MKSKVLFFLLISLLMCRDIFTQSGVDISSLVMNSIKKSDTDHDGVPDYMDQCSTVPGSIENNGCPDGDTSMFIEVKNISKNKLYLFMNSDETYGSAPPEGIIEIPNGAVTTITSVDGQGIEHIERRYIVFMVYMVFPKNRELFFLNSFELDIPYYTKAIIVGQEKDGLEYAIVK